VQRVWQPDDSSIVLALYKDGKEALFLISCHPVFARAHFTTRKPQNAQPMPGLGTTLRARIDGARIGSIQQIDFDRILLIELLTKDGPHAIVAELMSKHSNIMFLDPDQRVVAAAKWIGKSKSVRPIQANKKYEAPPFAIKRPLTQATESDDLSDFQGVSPFLKKLIAQQGFEQVQEAIATGKFHPVYSQGFGAYPISVASLGYSEVSRESISSALEQHFEWAIRNEEIRSIKESMLAQLRRVLLAREVAIADLAQAADTAKRAGEFQLQGELLLAYASQVTTGATLFETQDYEGHDVTIKLDPEKTPLENANYYFTKAKHAKSREGIVKDQLHRIKADKDAIESLLTRVEGEERLDRLKEFREEAKKHRWLHDTTVVAKKKDERPYEGHRIRELLGPGGFTVLYGENSEANDFLTVRVAKPNDYWLHVRGSASAHVVIVTRNRPEKVGKETLMFAAKVVVQHSQSKHSGYVPVDYTLKKYVRKPKGAAKGMAMYTHEKTLHVGD
jgi:predicted ribosome quality control (RQC) complex YloA/Tae2 family protein